MTDTEREDAVLDRIEAFRRRRPRLTDEVITLAHGAGGKASAALIDAVFLEAFAPTPAGDPVPPPGDAACLALPGGIRLAFSTDSFVVTPRRFPGGSLGHLAVHGTVNDLAMAGARPAWLSAAFVIEEGFPVSELRELVADMAMAAADAGITIVTGDTKVVDRGAADGLYITTAGVGVIPAERRLGPELVRPGDRVIVSGTIADHGMAVMLARGNLELEADIRSDTAPLHRLVDALLAVAPRTRWLRDPTRGGVGTVCNELAQASELGVVLDEGSLPIDPAVAGACDLLGIDPLYVANEGKLVAIVPEDEVAGALAALRAQPCGRGAEVIGEIVADPPGIVVLRTAFGGTRIVDMLVGDPLPPHLLMPERRRVRVTGTVQGVGFRPFVYRHALALDLTGFVRNDTEGVLVEAEGTASSLDELGRLLVEAPPPLARVSGVLVTTIASRPHDRRFEILTSGHEGALEAAVSIDGATCEACLAEVADPGDRRHRYPFTNCTDCGPRYTIVTAVPYDRPATTMAGFAMCRLCQAEYDDPADRRFHAQPNACPACGPSLRLCLPDGTEAEVGDEAMHAAATSLRTGHTVAVKGLGGFHLACDATDPDAVALLRRRKARDDKPFAVLVADLQAADVLCELDDHAAAALVGPGRPIVLAPRREGHRVAEGVAPGLADLGLLLPYTALHHLLLAAVGRPLVLTSGNASDEPIAHTDEDALIRLGPLCDALLTHDRPIHIRCDDSIVRAAGGDARVVRRSRGMVPEPLRLPRPASRPLLAVGAELKSTIAVAKGAVVTVSHHIGDLEHLAAHRSFLQAIDHLCHLAGVRPELVAHDLHPEYLSTKRAIELDLPCVGVQHHHAHIASCLAEHGRDERVLGIAFDGTGLGPDGSLWGGELLVADLDGYERVGHLAPVPLPGGAAAIREPWRMAVAWTHAALGHEAALREGAAHEADPSRVAGVASLVARGPSPTTTSAGRLFDAVAALLGVRSCVTYEAQAAIELEALARTVGRAAAPTYPVELRWSNSLVVVDPTPLISTVIEERDAGTPVREIAAGVHEGLGRATAGAAIELARQHGLSCVALSGGVFQNARLTEVVERALADADLEVLTHRRVPCNDGGISVGQAAVAAAR